MTARAREKLTTQQSTENTQPSAPLDIKIMGDQNGLTATPKTIYGAFNNTINSLPSTTTIYLQRTGLIPDDKHVPWKSIYHLPASKREGDVQFRLLHNILPSLQVLHHIDPGIPRQCGSCGDESTISHLFITCPAIQLSLTLLHTLLHWNSLTTGCSSHTPKVARPRLSVSATTS